MHEFLIQLWSSIAPQIMQFVLLVVSAALAWASAKVISWANGEKADKAVAEAVVMAEVAKLPTGEAKLNAVTTALQDAGVKATRAQIEVQVAKLTKQAATAK